MELFLYLFTFFTLSTAELRLFEVFPKIADRCGKSVELTKEFPGLYDENHSLSRDAKCFMACFHQIYGVVSNEVQIGILHNILKYEIGLKILKLNFPGKTYICITKVY